MPTPGASSFCADPGSVTTTRLGCCTPSTDRRPVDECPSHTAWTLSACPDPHPRRTADRNGGDAEQQLGDRRHVPTSRPARGGATSSPTEPVVSGGRPGGPRVLHGSRRGGSTAAGAGWSGIRWRRRRHPNANISRPGGPRTGAARGHRRSWRSPGVDPAGAQILEGLRGREQSGPTAVDPVAVG
jgi:hypothetical protein